MMWQQYETGTVGDPPKIPLPVDITMNSDGQSAGINTFMDGTTRLWGMSDPKKC